ncbi:hypothetical protein VPH49_22690 [Pseudomonas luteola]|uniref:hypothetical protein n=1 Tax=Pseudomonas luteola TaxID=47886 RepID=UPI003A8A2D3B
MNLIADKLARLDPPLKFLFEPRGTDMLLTLIDPAVPARVQRRLDPKLMMNKDALNLTLVYAVNELRAKGSHGLWKRITFLSDTSSTHQMEPGASIAYPLRAVRTMAERSSGR